MASLLISSAKVEVPYILVQIGQYTFGAYSRSKANIEINGKYYGAVKVNYPNYIQSLSVQKVNGTLNTYTLNLEYPITANDDPNLIDKILSSVSQSRKIIFTYGDCMLPSFMYKSEEALITGVTSSVDISSNKISYTISATSAAMQATAQILDFPRYSNRKPSNLIKQLLRTQSYGLTKLFYGMHDIGKVEQLGLIPGDDKTVTIPAKKHISILDYLNFLVECMSNQNDLTTNIKKTVRYVLTIHDDTTNTLGGPYFKIDKVYNTVQSQTSLDYYVVDIGYPNKDMVTSFTINQNDAYSILYDYANKIEFTDSIYRIGDDGEIEKQFSPALTNSRQLDETTEAEKTWWSQMTQFPIQATLTIRGLLRAAVLMSYVRLNVFFYGSKKHSSSGLYIITKQVDEINNSGCKTTLTLTRVGGDIE